MHLATTTPARRTAPEVSVEPPENRAWGFFGYSVRLAWEIDPQVVEGHLEKTTAGTTTASGVPYWPSRDPIGEGGGLNLYGFVGNDGVNWIDVSGLARYEVDGHGLHVHTGTGKNKLTYVAEWVDGCWKLSAKKRHESEFRHKEAISDFIDRINNKEEREKIRQVNSKAWDEYKDKERVEKRGRALRRAGRVVGFIGVCCMFAENKAVAEEASELLNDYIEASEKELKEKRNEAAYKLAELMMQFDVGSVKRSELFLILTED